MSKCLFSNNFLNKKADLFPFICMIKFCFLAEVYYYIDLCRIPLKIQF